MNAPLTRRLNGWLFALLVVLGAGAIGFLTARHDRVADWTYNSRVSMSPETRAVLAKLNGPVDIVSYASPQGDLRQTIAAAMQRYQQAKPDLHLSFVDPQKDPTAMRNLGITVDGELILHYRDRQQRLDTLNERSLTDALERLVRGNDRIVAFVTGDGERRGVVIGNGDFLSNSYLGNGGNRALGDRIFDWLLGDDELINMPPRGAPDRVLTVSQSELSALSIVFILILPVLLLMIGGIIAWRRRRA